MPDEIKPAKDRWFVIRHVIRDDVWGGADHLINMAEHFPEKPSANGQYPIQVWLSEPVPLGTTHAKVGTQIYRDLLMSFGVGHITIERVHFSVNGLTISLETVEDIQTNTEQGELS